jgi:hypothetical protein
MKYDQLEVARIIGQPIDPRKPYTDIVNLVCETDTATPEDYIYYFDVLVETEKIFALSAGGDIQQENVQLDTPAQISFTDLATPEYYLKITDLANRKEDAIARKNKTINRALNAYENYKVISLLNTAATAVSHTQTLGSGYTRFSFPHLVNMLEQVQDYGDSYVLIVGSQIDKDIILWDWNDNKYHSLSEALADLRITKIRIGLEAGARTFNLATNASGGSTPASTDILAANTAYLVATSTEAGKPLLFVRKQIDDMKALGGVIAEGGERPQRLVFVSPNPITVTGTARYLAVGMTGYEQIAAAVVNPYAVSKFTRT